MLILTLHKKFLFELKVSSTKDSHQPKEVNKSPTGNAQESSKTHEVFPSTSEASFQFIFNTGQMIIPDICNNRQITIEREIVIKHDINIQLLI